MMESTGLNLKQIQNFSSTARDILCLVKPIFLLQKVSTRAAAASLASSSLNQIRNGTMTYLMVGSSC